MDNSQTQIRLGKLEQQVTATTTDLGNRLNGKLVLYLG